MTSVKSLWKLTFHNLISHPLARNGAGLGIEEGAQDPEGFYCVHRVWVARQETDKVNQAGDPRGTGLGYRDPLLYSATPRLARALS